MVVVVVVVVQSHTHVVIDVCMYVCLFVFRSEMIHLDTQLSRTSRTMESMLVHQCMYAMGTCMLRTAPIQDDQRYTGCNG